jgi:hypothetical protein
MSRLSRQNSHSSALLPLALVWLLGVVLLVVAFWPTLPRTWLQWFVFILVGPPLYVLGEEFFGWLFSSRRGAAISNSGFSFRRVLIALSMLTGLITVAWWLTWLLR